MALDTAPTTKNEIEAGSPCLSVDDALIDCAKQLNAIPFTENDEVLVKALAEALETLAFNLGYLIETQEAALEEEASMATDLPPLSPDLADRARVLAYRDKDLDPHPATTTLKPAVKLAKAMGAQEVPGAVRKNCLSAISPEKRSLNPEAMLIKKAAIELHNLAGQIYNAPVMDSLKILPEAISSIHKGLVYSELMLSFEIHLVEPMCEAISRTESPQISSQKTTPVQALAKATLEALPKAA